MSRLVVVSNRVALPGQASSGGLAVALQAALEETGGLWFGWSGNIADDASGQLHEQTAGNIDYVTVDLSRADHDDYYNGFANRTLWPLLHFRMDLVDYSRETWEAYRRVNALFADRLAPQLRDDDVVWIHDYHLIPLASLLRERGVRCKLGFFLHVPMPSSDILAALPHHGLLFEGLSAHDLVGFQTSRDLERFQDYVRLFGRGRLVEHGVLETASGRRLRAGAFPISIDTAGIERQAAAAVGKSSFKRLARSLSGRALAIGVDRLDYSKGLPERFRAFERYLQRYPDQIGDPRRIGLYPLHAAGREAVDAGGEQFGGAQHRVLDVTHPPRVATEDERRREERAKAREEAGATWRRCWHSEDPAYGGSGLPDHDEHEGWWLPPQAALLFTALRPG